MISISTSQTFRSWVLIFHLRRPMAFLSLNLYDTYGLAHRMNVLFWGPGDFPLSYSNRDTSWNAWNLLQEVLWSIQRSYSAIWSLPLTNVKWLFDPRLIVTSQPIRLSTNFMTLIPSLSFTELWVVFMKNFATGVACQQGTLTIPGSVPLFWDLLVLQCLKPYSSPCLYSTFYLEYPLVFSVICFKCNNDGLCSFVSWFHFYCKTYWN